MDTRLEYRQTTYEIEMLGETVSRVRAIISGNYSKWKGFPQRHGNIGWMLYAYGNWMRVIHNPWVGMGTTPVPLPPIPSLPSYPIHHNVNSVSECVLIEGEGKEEEHV